MAVGFAVVFASSNDCWRMFVRGVALPLRDSDFRDTKEGLTLEARRAVLKRHESRFRLSNTIFFQ